MFFCQKVRQIAYIPSLNFRDFRMIDNRYDSEWNSKIIVEWEVLYSLAEGICFPLSSTTFSQFALWKVKLRMEKSAFTVFRILLNNDERYEISVQANIQTESNAITLLKKQKWYILSTSQKFQKNAYPCFQIFIW